VKELDVFSLPSLMISSFPVYKWCIMSWNGRKADNLVSSHKVLFSSLITLIITVLSKHSWSSQCLFCQILRHPWSLWIIRCIRLSAVTLDSLSDDSEGSAERDLDKGLPNIVFDQHQLKSMAERTSLVGEEDLLQLSVLSSTIIIIIFFKNLILF